MPSLLGTNWTIVAATAEAPVQAQSSVTITPNGTVSFGGNQWPGTPSPDGSRVAVFPADNIYWEFIGSELVDGRFTMFGMTWTTTVPDAMGAWTADPQGT